MWVPSYTVLKEILTKAAYKVLKNLYNLLGGWWNLLSALHSHCKAEILLKKCRYPLKFIT